MQAVPFCILAFALLSWVFLLKLRGDFWRMEQAPPLLDYPDSALPDITVVIPARNEAETIAACLASIRAQNYPGNLSVILVDDNSSDGTAEAAAQAVGDDPRFRVIPAPPLQRGWTGKLWALNAGIGHAADMPPPGKYILLTDADIVHGPDSLRSLVIRAEAAGYDLVSEMVLLSCVTFSEKLMIPAFVFFFEMLYPFAWVNDPDSYTAAAAGGVILLRRTALDRIGGLASIKDCLIDDCSLAARVKREGPIHLSLSSTNVSLRIYGRLGEIWSMISRTAFAQLHYSYTLAALSALGMFAIFISPPLFLLSDNVWLRAGGALCWALSAYAYAPAVRFYRLSWLMSLTLPLIAALYLGATLDSCVRHALGRGGIWKGRIHGTGDE